MAPAPMLVKSFFSTEDQKKIQSSEYIGHIDYDPIWAELDRRQAVVFLHGVQTPSSTPYPNEFLGLPISEVRSIVAERLLELISVSGS